MGILILQISCIWLIVELNEVNFGTDSGTVVHNVCATFELAVFRVIWGSFGALLLKWRVTRKRLVVKQGI